MRSGAYAILVTMKHLTITHILAAVLAAGPIISCYAATDASGFAAAGAIADTATTEVALRAGTAQELNPLGAAGAVVIKAAVYAWIQSQPPDAAQRMNVQFGSITGGAAANNVCVLLSAAGPICLLIGAAVGVLLYNTYETETDLDRSTAVDSADEQRLRTSTDAH